ALAKRPEDRFASVSAMALALEQASQSHLPTERARSPRFLPQWSPSDTTERSPIPATSRTERPYQPPASSSHPSLFGSTTEAPSGVPQPGKVNEPLRASRRKRGTSQRLVLLGLTGLVIAVLTSSLIWFTSSHGALFGSVVQTTPAGS